MSKTRNSNNENYNSSRRGNKRKVSEYSNLTNNLAGYNNGVYGSIGSSGNSKKRGGVNDLSRLEKMVPTFFPSDHPFNKDGLVYSLF
jgi:hypothetical protein